MARSMISICNGALDECPSATINSLEDDAPEARACKRRYLPTLEDLLAEHDYDGAVRRVALGQVTNDRVGEWAYAYAYPDSVASTKRVLPTYTANYVGTAYTLLPGQFAWTGLGFFPANIGVPFIVAGQVIYTNMVNAVLEYITTDIRLTDFRPLFFRALELELAARIVMPLLKDRGRQRELIGMAEIARQRAMADDLNNSPDRSFDFVSEDAMVRLGAIDPTLVGRGYAS